MRGREVAARVALAISLLAMLLVTVGAAAIGYRITTHNQFVDRNRRLDNMAAYVRRSDIGAKTPQWQQALKRRLTALGLSAQLTVLSPTGKHAIYESSDLGPGTRSSPRPATAQPTETLTFPLAGKSRRTLLELDLYTPPLSATPRLLAALLSGLAALLAAATLLIWAASRWLVVPLRHLNLQVDAIAGGDPIQTHATSPIREVASVATGIEGMAARLAQTANQEARLVDQQRLLVSSIAHDLRTPLFALRGYLEAIAADIGDPRERLDQARSKVDQIDRLVTGLFDYARADIEPRSRLEPMDLAETVTGVARAFEPASSERGVELRVVPCTRLEAMIDRESFERALANVIDNAVRHTPPGGTVQIITSQDAVGPFVRVIDDGPGIPDDVLPHLFNPTTRSPRSSNTSGAGLGLTIAARLLQNQAGTIEAANTPGHGAILTLRLPGTPRSRSPDRPQSTPHRANRNRILDRMPVPPRKHNRA